MLFRKDFTDRFLALSDTLYKVAYYILESREDAEDAVQDLYIKLWRSADIIKKIENPKAYCISMMKNLCIDRIRKSKRMQEEEITWDIPEDEDMAGGIDARDTLNNMREGMHVLSDTERKMVELKLFDDKTYKEISEITGLDILTERVILSHARKKLKEYHEKH